MQASQIRVLEPRPTSFIEDWLGTLSAETQKAYNIDLSQFWAWLGHEDAGSVTRQDCQRYLAFLMDSGLARASINRKMGAIRGMLQEAVYSGIRDVNPMHGIKGFKAAGISKHCNAPTSNQVTAMLESIGTETLIDVRDRAMLYCAAGLGMRREELVKLTLRSITESNGAVMLTIVGKGTKTRSNGLAGNVLGAVRLWISRSGIKGNAPLFQGVLGGKPTGRPMHVNTVHEMVSRRLTAAGIQDCSAHSFRSFFVTEALRNGCELYKVQRAVGHADPRTTEIYDQARDDVEDSASGYVRI